MAIQYEKWIWVIVAAISATLPLLLIKYAINNERWRILLIMSSIVSYVILTYAYYRLLRLGRLGVLYGITKGISILLVFIAGILLFGDRLTWRSSIGIALVIIGILLL